MPATSGCSTARAKPSPSPSWLPPRRPPAPVATHTKLSGAAAVQHGARHPAAHGLDASPHPGGRAALGLGAHERLASPGGPAVEFGPVRDQGGGADAQRARGAGHRAAEHAGGACRCPPAPICRSGTREPVRGRLYRFEGEGAPVNMTLEFEQSGQARGAVSAAGLGQPGGRVADCRLRRHRGRRRRAPERVRAELAAPQAAGAGAVELTTGFLTPLAGLALTTPRANSLLPVRILGRNEASQPWRLLAQTVVYRLADAGGEAVNPPVALHGASARWLRVEASNGADLATAQLQATAEFEPLQLVFVATGDGPFQLAAGHARSKPAALPLATITSALGSSRKPEDLPAATIGASIAEHAGYRAARQVLAGAQCPARPPCCGACCLRACCCSPGSRGPCCGSSGLEEFQDGLPQPAVAGIGFESLAPVQRHREVAQRQRRLDDGVAACVGKAAGRCCAASPRRGRSPGRWQEAP